MHQFNFECLKLPNFPHFNPLANHIKAYRTIMITKSHFLILHYVEFAYLFCKSPPYILISLLCYLGFLHAKLYHHYQ